jgi:apolipoprotein N-acyltransferase
MPNNQHDFFKNLRKFTYLRTLFWDIFFWKKAFAKRSLKLYYGLHSKFAGKILYQIYKYRESWFLPFFAGAIGGLGQPPVFAFFLLPITFVICLRLIDFAVNLKFLFKVAVWFNFGYALVIFYWPAYGAYLFGYRIEFLPIFALGIILLSCFIPTAMFILFGIVSVNIKPFRRILLFASLWVICEYLRGFVIFNFPLGFIGYSVGKWPALYQSASVFGVLGLSLFLVLWACSFYLILFTENKLLFIAYFRAFIIINISLLFIGLLGFARLQSAKIEYLPYKVAIVQGNTSVKQNKIEDYTTYTQFTIQLQNITYGDLDIIIWPESAGIPFDFTNRTQESINNIKKFILPHQTFIFNAIRVNNQKEIFNTFYTYENNQLQFHDKKYLVPYGEYLPIVQKYQFGKAMARGAGIGFTHGKQMSTIPTQHGGILPLICYESTYSGYIGEDEIKADYIINITNDEWSGLSSGPFQHFTAAKYRAVEEGLSFVRAANNGVSTIIDPYGRLNSKQTKMFQKDVIISLIPKKVKYPTLFDFWGNTPLLLSVFLYSIFYICTHWYSVYHNIIHYHITQFTENRDKRKQDPNYKKRY